MYQGRYSKNTRLILSIILSLFIHSSAFGLNDSTSLDLSINIEQDTSLPTSSAFKSFIHNQAKSKLSRNTHQQLSKGVKQSVIVQLEDSDAFQEFSKKGYVRLSHLEKSKALNDHKLKIKKLNKEFQQLSTNSEIEIQRSYQYLPIALVKITNQKALDALLQSPKVKTVYEDKKLQLFLDESLPIINQPEASALGAMGEGTTIAIVDTGVDYSRAAFGSCSSPGEPNDCSVIFEHDFAVDDGQLDAHGHGTNVAGISLGVAPLAKIASLDVFSDDGAKESDIFAAFDWIIENQVEYNIVSVNLSLGAPTFQSSECTQSTFTVPFQHLRAVGVLPVVASGNNAFKLGLSQPACAPGAVSVGAVYDENFSNLGWGVCSDFAPKAGEVTCFSNSAHYLTLLAPGALITAAGHEDFAGTSMATPHVAGAVAVLRGIGGFPSDTLEETVSHMVSTGKPTVDKANGLTHPLLDLEAAILHGKPKAPPIINSFSPASAGVYSTVIINGNHFLEVTNVMFGGTSAESFIVDSASQIRAIIASNSLSGGISVTTSLGETTKTGFEFISSPIESLVNTPDSLVFSSIYNPVTIQVGSIYVDNEKVFDVSLAAQFSSSNASIATVDEEGTVRAIGEGTAYIYSHLSGNIGTTIVSVDFTSIEEREIEPNNTLDTANHIDSRENLYRGNLQDNHDIDYYQFEANAESTITVFIKPTNSPDFFKYVNASLIDENGNILASKPIGNGNSNFTDLSIPVVNAGTYYLRIDKYSNYSVFTGDYEFVLQKNDDPVSFSRREREPNDTLSIAPLYSFKSGSIYGQLADYSDVDYFAFDLTPGLFNVQVRSTIAAGGENNTFSIVDASGAVLAAKDVIGYTTAYTPLSARINTAGKYYVVVTKDTTYSRNYFAQDYELIPELSQNSALFNAHENEPNNSIEGATLYPVGSGSLYGQLSSYSDIDYFAFNLTPGVFSVQAKTSYSSSARTNTVSIIDASGTLLAARDHKTNEAPYAPLTARIDTAGTYYVVISKDISSTTNYFDHDYELIPEFSDDETLLSFWESEQNDTAEQAALYPVGLGSLYGQLSSDSDVDYFAFDLSPGVFSIQARATDTTDHFNNTFSIIDASGNILAARDVSRYTTSYISINARINTAGTYYVMVTKDASSSTSYFAQDYELIPQFSDDNTLFVSRESEPNNTAEQAVLYPVGAGTLYGQLSNNSDVDYFSFYLNSGVFSVQAKAVSNTISIIDASGNVLAEQYVSGNTTYAPINARINAAGTYYVMVSGSSFSDQDYELIPAFSDDGVLFASRESEPNNTAEQAVLYSVGSGSLFGELSSYSDIDYFAFDLEIGTFNVQARATGTTDYSYNTFSIIDGSGNALAAQDFGLFTTPHASINAHINTAGTYYVVVTKDTSSSTSYFGQDYELIPLFTDDSDQDGIPDTIEIALGLNLNDATDAGGDLDDDGYSNLQEYQAGTDPQNDTSLPHGFRFADTSYIVNERDGVIGIPVIRTGENTGAISVQCQTTDGTAEAGQDYTALDNSNGWLNWADGDSSIKYCTLGILSDEIIEGNETFTVNLLNPSTDSYIGTPNNTVINILTNTVQDDFNGDGKADILIRNFNNNQLYLFEMDGNIRTGKNIGAVSTNLSIIGLSDLGGDGKADIILRNKVTGMLELYEMDSNHISSKSTIGPLSTTWDIESIADLNGDGKGDLVLRNNSTGQLFLYEMDANSRIGSDIGGLPLEWDLVDTGDLGGDGKDDLIIRNKTSGQLYLYEMNGNIRTGSNIGGLALNWEVIGVGDVGGDTKDDIIIRNKLSGQLYLYEMNGNTRIGSNIGGLPLSWSVESIADYSGDGKADLLLRHDSGQLYLYEMDGSIVSGSSIGALNNQWNIEP